jgi:hypothetical protein
MTSRTPLINVDQRRARLGLRHHLARPAKTVEQATESVVAWHSTAAASVYLSAWARLRRFERADLTEAIYERRTLVRMLGMRRTVFVVPVGDAKTVDGACAQALVPGERKKLIALLEAASGPPPADAWLRRVEKQTLAALEAAGEATAAELSKLVPDLGLKLHMAAGKKYEGTIGVGSRVLFLLSASGHIVRGRPIGTWLSSQYRWAPASSWVEGDLAGADPTEARADLVRLWLRAFGPGTLTDIKWWTGWTVAQTKAALQAADAVEVDIETGPGDAATGFLLADDLAPVRRPSRWVALLPTLDPTIMGWKEREWYLGPHQERLFDRNGNAGPTVWCDGRIVGGWGHRADGSVSVELLEGVDAKASAMIEAERVRLASWLDGARATPPFRTPLERAMSS